MTGRFPPAAAWAARFIFCALVLAGCATTEPPLPSSPLARSDKPPAQQFSLKARLSVKVENRLDVVSLNWEREQGGDHIDFYSPFGSQVAELTQSSNGGATLRRGKEVQTAASVAELTASLLGVDLDLNQVALWIQAAGLNVGEPRDVPTGQGPPWRVTLEGIAQEKGYDRATRLSAVKEGVMVKMVIEEWQPK